MLDYTLYHEDCLNVLPNIERASVNLIFTSPPYNMGKEYEHKMSMGDYVKWQGEVIAECARVLTDDGSICWQVGNYVKNNEVVHLDILLYPLFVDLGFKLRNRVIWNFEHGVHATHRLSGRYETIMWFTHDNYYFNLDNIRVPQKYPDKKHYKGPHKGELSGNILGKNPGDVWAIPNVKHNHPEKTEHPCQFPVELPERFILATTRAYDVVLDPFSGSATTMIATIKHSRKAIGIESFDKYFNISNTRLAAFEEERLKIRESELWVQDRISGFDEELYGEEYGV